MRTYERRNASYLLTTDRERISLDDIEAFLRRSYWAAQRPRETIARTLETSLCFVVIDERDERTVAFSRVVTDYADSRGFAMSSSTRARAARASASG